MKFALAFFAMLFATQSAMAALCADPRDLPELEAMTNEYLAYEEARHDEMEAILEAGRLEQEAAGRNMPADVANEYVLESMRRTQAAVDAIHADVLARHAEYSRDYDALTFECDISNLR